VLSTTVLDLPVELFSLDVDRSGRHVLITQDPGLVQEWLRRNNLIYGALIAIGVFMMQPFLTAPSLDPTASICVIAFAVAIPLLAALVMVNRQEAFRRRASRSVLVTLAQVVGELAAGAAVSGPGPPSPRRPARPGQRPACGPGCSATRSAGRRRGSAR
jgi:hypothetical protein